LTNQFTNFVTTGLQLGSLMSPVPVDVGLTPELAVGHIDRHRAGLVVLGRLVDFPEFALGQAQIFSTTWRDRDRVPIFTDIKEERDQLSLPNLPQFALKVQYPRFLQ
jgi:hypothetical protein